MQMIIVLDEREYQEIAQLCQSHSSFKDSQGSQLRGIIRLIAHKLEIPIQMCGKDEN